jgi:hypothetical protein
METVTLLHGCNLYAGKYYVRVIFSQLNKTYNKMTK